MPHESPGPLPQSEGLPAEGISSLVAPLLPPPWSHEVSAELAPDGFVVRFRDLAGRAHAFEARRREAGREALVRGELLGFSYLGNGPDLPVEEYRQLFARLVAVEAALEAAVRDQRHRPALQPDERSVYVIEALLARALLPGSDVRRLAARLLEPLGTAGAARVDLYLDAPCEQACEYCTHPLTEKTLAGRAGRLLHAGRRVARLDAVSRGLLDALLEAAAAREPAAHLKITAADWARHPRLEQLLRRLERERRVPVSFQGPSTRLADPTLAARVAALPTLQHVDLTLQSARPALHDAMAGADGCGRATQQAIENLRRAGARVRVWTVLTARAVEELPQTLAWLHERRLDAWLNAFLPDVWAPGWAGSATPRADQVRTALEAAGAAGACIAILSGLPFCAVPPPLRSRLAAAARGELRERSVKPASCSGCRHESACEGVPDSYVRLHGGRGLAAER